MMCGYCQLTPCDHQGLRDGLEQCEQDLKACVEALEKFHVPQFCAQGEAHGCTACAVLAVFGA